MSEKSIWSPCELTEDIIVTSIPSEGSSDEFGLSDDEISADTTIPFSEEYPVYIDESTEVILDNDPIFSTVALNKDTSSPQLSIGTPAMQEVGPSTSFQSVCLSPLFILSPSPSTSSIQNLPSVNHDNHPQQADSNVNCDNFVDDEIDNTPLIFRSNKKTFPWKLHHNNVCKKPFTEDITNTFDDDTTSPTDFFYLLFPQNLIDEIVFQTNLYAAEKQGGECKNPTSSKEIKNFLAINIVMGVKRLPSYRDYWSSNVTLRDPFISSVMPFNRFSWLLNNIHFADNSNMPSRDSANYDKLFKIRPVLNKLSETYSSVYKPTQNQSIDESMIKFKGRSSLKQYMPKKPIKRGYKVWTRADARGFVVQFDIYTGKVVGYTENNLGARVVRNLCEPLFGKSYNVYLDNFFTSLPLFHFLQEKDVYACGTALKGRKYLPKKFKPDRKMKRGDFQFKSSESGISCVKWMDNKGILFLSNHHNPNDIVTVQRKQRDGTRVTLPCPALVKDYNVNMGFVDKADMLKSTYAINRKSKRWYMRIFWHFLDVTVVNAYIMFGLTGEGKQMNLKEFRLAVANGLLSKSNKDKSKAKLNSVKFRQVIPLEQRTLGNQHLPVRSTWKRCNYCSTSTKQVRSYWACSQCQVSLCLNDKKNCFYDFHNSK